MQEVQLTQKIGIIEQGQRAVNIPYLDMPSHLPLFCPNNSFSYVTGVVRSYAPHLD